MAGREYFGHVDVRLDFHSQAQADAWEANVNGSDDRKDPCLAMERALNECLGFGDFDPDPDGPDQIWVSPA